MISTVTTTSKDPPLDRLGNEEKSRQLSRILNSAGFSNARLLQKFLEFVVSKSIEGNLDELNEYVIATEILGRKQDFDPASNTSVRTQAYRLRSKLKEYYATEGKSDPLVIEIPKGHHVPVFALRSELQSGASEAEIAQAETPASAHSGQGNFRFAGIRLRTVPAVFSLSAIAVVCLLTAMFAELRSFRALSATTADPKVNESLARFWAASSSKAGVVLAFTNPEFLETTTGDLLPIAGERLPTAAPGLEWKMPPHQL